MRSFISTFPMRAPLRIECVKYGAFDMLSMPPATTTSASPSAITRAPSITASRPDPHTLLTVTQGVVFGSPAYNAAWRAGAWPTPPCSTWPMKTVLTSSGFTPARYLEGTRRAAEAALRVLLQGGSALDAAQAAAVVLEDDASFNAGTGAALTSEGEVELDASCMDGTTLRAGAVACVKTMKNPILSARRVCDDTPHVLICGPGAEAFARECGIPEVANSSLITDRQRTRWEELHALALKEGADSVRRKIGTIGAVAVDAKGHVAACTSTGGTMYKRPGRVGDTPIIGAGTYADAHEAAASSTGLGEAILKVTMAREACAVVRDGVSPGRAATARRGLRADR